MLKIRLTLMMTAPQFERCFWSLYGNKLKDEGTVDNNCSFGFF